MTDPIQFLIAAVIYHPAAPYLVAVLSLGPLSVAFIALDIRVRRSGPRNLAKNRAVRTKAPPSRPVPTPVEHLALATIERVPVLDAPRATLLERLEDVVECLGQAQRVLPDIVLSRALRIRPEPGDTEMNAATQCALNRAGLDFGVFSYAGNLDLALMIGARAEAEDDRQLIETALERAGVPLIRIPLDAPPDMLRTRIRSALSPATGLAMAA